MIDCAGMKVNNLREEDRLRKKAQEKAEREQFENAKRLENLKKRTHRQDENKALFDADSKYYEKEANNVAGSSACASMAVSSAAASLELSSVSGQMRNLELTKSAMSQSAATGQAVNLLI